MGSAGSRFDELPVTGHATGLVVVPAHNNRYLRTEATVLKLREKYLSFSGDDCSVKDINGTKWFKISESALSMTIQRTLTDSEGNVVAGYRKKLLSFHNTAYITIKDQDQTMALATIKQQSQFRLKLSADIYIHNPPMKIDDVTTSGLPVAIHVEGDILSHKYDFMMGNLNTDPYKIAQVVRKFRNMLQENSTYYIEIGQNIDIAFICLCTYAIDEIFSEN